MPQSVGADVLPAPIARVGTVWRSRTGARQALLLVYHPALRCRSRAWRIAAIAPAAFRYGVAGTRHIPVYPTSCASLSDPLEAGSSQVQVKLPPAFPSGALERERNRLVSQHSWVVVTNERNASHEAAGPLLAWRSARLQRKTGPRI